MEFLNSYLETKTTRRGQFLSQLNSRVSQRSLGAQRTINFNRAAGKGVKTFVPLTGDLRVNEDSKGSHRIDKCSIKYYREKSLYFKGSPENVIKWN